MVISKFICIPLLILVPLIILIFESRQKDFAAPPSDEEVAQKVEAWKATRPSLSQGDADKEDVHKNEVKPEPQPDPEPEPIELDLPKIDATKGIDLGISPGLNHLQGMKVERLKLIVQQLDANSYPELIYLSNERILDSAPDSTIEDLHAAGKYLSKNGRPLWNPEESLRVPLKVNLNVEASHYEKATALKAKIESAIFYGSGGTVKPTVTVTKVENAKNSISLSGKKSTEAVSVLSVSDTEKMIVNAIQSAVTNAIKTNQLSILHTDKIHYTYYTRLTWLMLAEAL